MQGVIFTDEWGGGTRPRCRATDPVTWGANAIIEIVDRKFRFAGSYKLPAPQTERENCVAHNGSLVPVPGRDIMVQGRYQGGVSVFDFSDPAQPVEIAFFDRGPVDAKELITNRRASKAPEALVLAGSSRSVTGRSGRRRATALLRCSAAAPCEPVPSAPSVAR